MAAKVSDLDLRTYKLHPLKGEMAGFWSVRVSRNWRIIFRFEEGDAYDVNLVDYHQKQGAESMSMDYPTHPGISIREGCLAGELTVTEAARMLGVARHTLSRVLNGHAGISPEMAVRLEKVGWSNAEFWVRRQAAYDLAQARLREDQIAVGTPESRVPVSS